MILYFVYVSKLLCHVERNLPLPATLAVAQVQLVANHYHGNFIVAFSCRLPHLSDPIPHILKGISICKVEN